MSAQERPATRPSGFASSASVRGGRVFVRERYAATQTASASLAGSDGWKVTGPIVTQRRAPLTGSLTSNTAASSRMLTATNVGAACRHHMYGVLAQTTRTTSPVSANNAWRMR